jgi:hypothetical protein
MVGGRGVNILTTLRQVYIRLKNSFVFRYFYKIGKKKCSHLQILVVFECPKAQAKHDLPPDLE